ncbi:MAG: FCD domain-containing protein [Mycobacterium sp.]
MLTGQVAAWAAERLTPDDVVHLRTLAADVEALRGSDRIGDANWQFHHIRAPKAIVDGHARC